MPISQQLVEQNLFFNKADDVPFHLNIITFHSFHFSLPKWWKNYENYDNFADFSWFWQTKIYLN